MKAWLGCSGRHQSTTNGRAIPNGVASMTHWSFIALDPERTLVMHETNGLQKDWLA